MSDLVSGHLNRFANIFVVLVRISLAALQMLTFLPELLMVGTTTRLRTTTRITAWTRLQVILNCTAMPPRSSGRAAIQWAAQPMIVVEQHSACGLLCVTTTPQVSLSIYH